MRGEIGTRGEHMLNERHQENVKVINIHRRDKGGLSKQGKVCMRK